jgi:hypothetical protein
MIQFKEYEKCPDKRYYIEFLVLKNISRVLKNHKLFAKFRCTIGYRNGGKMAFPYRITHVMDNTINMLLDNNPFRRCESIEDILKVMSGGYEFNSYDNDAKVQKKVTDCINMLLHILLERIVQGSFSILEEIGSETFKITCEELFGENFVDHTIPEGVDMNVIHKISEMSRRGELPELSDDLKRQLDKFMEYIKRNNQELGDFNTHDEQLNEWEDLEEEDGEEGEDDVW